MTQTVAFETHPIDGRDEPFEVVLTAEEVDAAMQEVAKGLVTRCQELGVAQLVLLKVMEGAEEPSRQVLEYLEGIEGAPKVIVDAIKVTTRDGDRVLSEPVIDDEIRPKHILPGSTVAVFDDLYDHGISAEAIRRLLGDTPEHVLFATPFNKLGVPKVEHGYQPGNVIIGRDVPEGFLLGVGLDHRGYGRKIPRLLRAINM